MAIFARVEDGIVREIYVGDELFPMTEELMLTWHVAPDGTEYGYLFDGNNFVAPAAPTNEELLVEIRAQRDVLLGKTDYTQMIDTPIETNCKALFVIYRQELRDFPENCNPQNPVWPVKPAYVKE